MSNYLLGQRFGVGINIGPAPVLGAICAKLGNQYPPNGPTDTGGINRLVEFFQGLGFDAKEARDGLTEMLKFAYGLRAA